MRICGWRIYAGQIWKGLSGSRLFGLGVPAGAAANRAALFRRAIRGGGLGCFYQFWFFRCLLFCCFSVGLKTFDCSFAFDLSELIAPLGLHARRTRLFSHALLNIQKMGGAQAFTREEIMVLVCSPSALIPKPISPRGLHAPGVSPPGCPVGFGV